MAPLRKHHPSLAVNVTVRQIAGGETAGSEELTTVKKQTRKRQSSESLKVTMNTTLELVDSSWPFGPA